MDFELNPTPQRARRQPRAAAAEAAFEISSRPLIGEAPAAAVAPAPSAAAIPPTLCLMARDPHTLFAYWEIDWTDAFRDGKPADRKVHLRLLNSADKEQTVEVEPMAGSAYLPVDGADEEYRGEIGFFRPAGKWNALAVSANIATPPDSLVDFDETEWATVPFHLSFQRMIDMLRTARAPLTVQLAELRERSAAPETEAMLSAPERELNRAVRAVESRPPAAPGAARPNELSKKQKQKRLERILGFGGAGLSPAEGFGGASENGLGGSSRGGS